LLMQKLKEYADRSDTELPTMYKRGRIQWFINLDREGNLIGNGFVATSGGDKKGKEYIIPHCGAKTSGIKSNLLVDSAEYALGVDRTKIDKKTAQRHEKFVLLIIDCAKKTSNYKVIAVAKFLEKLKLDALELPKEMKYNSIVSFLVEGEMPTDDKDVQEYWKEKNQVASEGAENIGKVKCHICGNSCYPVSPHPQNIRGLGTIGGQTSGMTLISANSEAFESYGLEKSLIAPTCHTCAEAYATAANDLIKNSDTHITVGPLIYLFWTKNDLNIPLVSLITAPNPDPEQVKRLVLSSQKGVLYYAMDDEAFYATAWSASGARVAVRDWIMTTVGNVRNNLVEWFELQKLASEYEDARPFYGIWSLAASLYQKPANQMVANVPKALLHMSLQGGKLPDWILYQAVNRNKAGRSVTRPRLVLIKMALLSSWGIKKEGYLVELDKGNTNPAYLCGRLLAELEAIQRASINPKATIVDRFYGSASTAPASVFGNLMRGTQAHLAKLRKEKPGLAVVFQKRLKEIQSGLMGFPRVLTMEEQGLFALGYYHQRVYDRSKADSKGQESHKDFDEEVFNNNDNQGADQCE
jgi:CRISPR-associated protein Csd1